MRQLVAGMLLLIFMVPEWRTTLGYSLDRLIYLKRVICGLRVQEMDGRKVLLVVALMRSNYYRPGYLVFTNDIQRGVPH